MEQISIVKRRSRLLPILLIVILLAILALAVFWFWGDRAPANFGLTLLIGPASTNIARGTV